MTPALIGFVGIIAGGVLSGGVQWMLAQSDRRLAARTAARLLFTHLSFARDAIDATVKRGWDHNEPWGTFVAAWVEHRNDLARILGTRDFLIVSSTFTGIENLGRRHAEDRQGIPPDARAPLSVPGAKQIEDYDAHVERALEIVHTAAYRWHEKRRGEHEISLAALNAASAIQRRRPPQ
jgi:hypothetical protein